MTTTIDFNDLVRGTIVDDEYAGVGVTISASGGSNQAMIFDSARPTGGDDDLATSDLGNVLIVSEDGDSSDPDDNARGGVITFDFAEPVSTQSLTVLDWDNGGRIKLFDADGNLIDSFYACTTDGGQQVVDIETDDVARMVVSINGSGAIDNFVFEGPEIAQPDGIVDGTEGDDVIDIGYVGDPDGDRVDNGDALLPGEVGDDDIILAGDGDDIVLAGAGNDEVFGGDGNDLIDGGIGRDALFGGANRDRFTGLNAGDTVDGGSGGDDIDVLDLTGSADPDGSLSVTITGPDSNGNGFDGVVTYFDEFGATTGTLTFTDIEDVVPCFTPGTVIATPAGEVPVEQLAVGDKVITRDNGIQEIRWIGRKGLTGADLARSAHLKPVRINKGALGHGLPERDMLVSPNHRVLVANDKTALYFEESEVLVAAKHLTGLKGIAVEDARWVTYIHIMFDQHEVILSDGAWTESFQPGDISLGSIGNAQRNEIFELFPELQTKDGLNAYSAARRSLRKHEVQLLKG